MNHIFPRLAFALLLFLFGCAPSNEIQNLVFPTQCGNACWMGIEPGVSTVDETLEILEKTYGSENVIRDEGAGTITWDTNNADLYGRGIVLYQNDLVDSILVWFSGDDVKAKDIITDIGNPHSVGLVISGPDIKCAGGFLLYPETGVQVYLSPVGKSVGVSETQNINGLGIYQPWTSDNLPWTDTEAVPWDGYHEYCPEKWSWEE